MDKNICRCFDALPVPVLIIRKKESSLLYVNLEAKKYGFACGVDFFDIWQDKENFLALQNGAMTQCTAKMKLKCGCLSAEITVSQINFQNEPCLVGVLTRIEPYERTNVNTVILKICDLFIDGHKQPLLAWLHLTARFAGAFYAALYEKTKERYLIKGEWRQRRSVCVPILCAGFDENADSEMERQKRLRDAPDAIYIPYTKKCGTQSAALYFFDHRVDPKLFGELEKCLLLLKALLPEQHGKSQAALIKKGLDALPEGFALWNAASMRLLYKNKAYESLFKDLNALMISGQLRADMRAGKRRLCEYTDQQGHSYAIAHHAVRGGPKTFVATLVSDVTGFRYAEKRLEKMARTDTLTGLMNRRAGIEKLHEVYAQCKGKRLPLTVCFADIDGLKHINDTCGHDQGDKLIRLAADMLQNHVEEIGYVCRLGGDEFVLILPGIRPAQARLLAIRIEKAVAKHQINGGISLSFGFTEAVYTPDENADTLISSADIDMYKEKRKRIR